MASGLRDVPHQQAGYMAAPTSRAMRKETLAKPEPSIHGPFRPVRDWQLVRELQPVSRFVPGLAASEGIAAGFERPPISVDDPFLTTDWVSCNLPTSPP